jgi:C-terminal processing protease CtpA/Prc
VAFEPVDRVTAGCRRAQALMRRASYRAAVRGTLRLAYAAAGLILVACATPQLTFTPPPKSKPQSARVDIAADVALRDIDLATDFIERNYLEPIDAPTLIDACLESLDLPAPDEADDRSDSKKIIADALKRAHEQDPARGRRTAVDHCMAGMLSGLKGDSKYFDEAAYQEMKGTAPVAGIGVEISTVEQGVRVVAPIEGGPAARAGIKAGDILTHIDQTELRGKPLAESARLLKGAPGSAASVTLQRASDAMPTTLTLKREILHIEPVKGRLLEPGIAYVSISQFTERTPEKLSVKLAELSAQTVGPLTGIVLDLRASSGGLLNTSVAVAAALQDHKRAVVLGTRTYRKGIVETILPLSGRTALKVATASMFRPNGEALQDKGVMPDVVVEASTVPGPGFDPVLLRAVQVLRKVLTGLPVREQHAETVSD